MQSLYNFIVEPIGKRYNNTIDVDGKELILNTEIFNHQYINRLAKVIATPLLLQSPLKVGDEVIVHHNVFRRWHNMRGEEKNSRSYWKENKYIVSEDQIYLYNNRAMPGYSFVKPIKSTDKFNNETEKPLVGIVKYSDGTFNKEELVGFKPSMEYEFIIDNNRLYRMRTTDITIKYEYKGDEVEYNPSWAKSG